jgi:hypothetical protein
MTITVTDADIRAFITAASNFDFGSLTVADFDQFLFQGFDPWKIIEELTKTKGTKNIPDVEMGRDMAFIVGISIITGAPTESKRPARLSAAGQKTTKNLAIKWGVNWGGGKGKGARHVNFPRVALALPIVTVKIILLIGPKEFPNDMLSHLLPKCMQHPCFPSIIPTSLNSDVKRMLLNACLCYGIDMSISLQSIDKPDVKVIAAKQKSFIRSSNSSKIPEEPDRLVFFKSLGLALKYDEVKKVLENFILKVDETYKCPDETEYIKSIKG